MFFIRLWGTRGSIACAGPATAEFGGNTISIEIRAGSTVSCVDFGTGARPFGEHLLKHDIPNGLTNINFFITHTHWDHIIGFPMFTPVYIPKIKLNIYSPYMINGKTLEQMLKTELAYEYWPVGLNEMSAGFTFHQVRETKLDLKNGLRVVTKYLNHPVINMGYRFEYQGKSIAVVHDTEPFFNQFSPALNTKRGGGSFFDEDASREAEKTAKTENGKIISFMKNADIAVYDAQYTEEQYITEKLNWGHSSYECAIENAIAAGVNRLLLNHHDPSRNDVVLCEIEARLKKQYGGKIQIDMAREGMKLDLL